MTIETWFMILLATVLLMSELVRLSRNSRSSGAPRAPRRMRKRAAKTPKREQNQTQVSYALAPKEPDVMAGTLFGLLAEILNHGQMVAFSDIVLSSEMTRRYIERLGTREATAATAGKLAFFNEAMDVNGYGGEQRGRVAEVIRRRADKQYKLLEIHRNMDKIL
jgi:hypothetical protein